MTVTLSSLDEARKELMKLKGKQLVNAVAWSPYQTFAHCAKTIEYSISGYPALKPTIVRNTVGRLAIRKFLKQGYMQHNLVADVPGSPAIDNTGSAQDGVQMLIKAIDKFKAYKGEFKPHLLFGRLTKAQYDQYFAMHIANHLSAIDSSKIKQPVCAVSS